MTKATTVAGELPCSNFPSAVTKRKTPSDLRGQILKRKTVANEYSDTAVTTSPISNEDGSFSEYRKSDSSKPPRYIDTHIPYPVTKTSIRNGLLSEKETFKKAFPNHLVPNNLCAKRQAQDSCLNGVIASEGDKDNWSQANNSINERVNVTFPSLTDLFSADEMLHGSSVVDMDKAFKAVLSRQPEPVDRIKRDIPEILCPGFILPGHNIPLDLTLKTAMRLQSSSSVNWFHRLINRATLNDARYQGKTMACTEATTSSSWSEKQWFFRSWVHPQSTLPRSAISALTLGGGHVDFLLKRQHAWEDSFRSLYYMFRKKICRIFYVCSEQFVVLFTVADDSMSIKCSSHAYISQSTTHLRSLLKEHDISFSMPLCQTKVEEVTSEDLVELSEIAKHNLGQARSTVTASVDYGPQSLLMITGQNVHGLYEFLLNYRVCLTSLSGDDVPVLYSPILFENAALSAPEVRCKEVRRADFSPNEEAEPYTGGSTPGISYSIEITDAYLPPWIISDVCNAMRCNGGDFQASFKTKSTSIGLNVGLGIARDQPVQQNTADEPQPENCLSFGVPNSILSPHLNSAYLDGLRYSDDSYTASLSRINN